ncbi:MAG: tRNA pseudouridine(55) synthase TruB [Ignavibacteria bacterium]|nr:tRNA pseudouridine(55) synthase TruB [Ignavibacteria bacterium]
MITRKTPEYDLFFSDGGASVLIDKPYKWSSFKVIHELRKKTGIRKAGHAGTLDPHATGLLIVCSHRHTKRINDFQDLSKEYTGTIRLGQNTPSMDTETAISEERSIEHLSADMIIDAAKQLTGDILQVPPMYSACNHKGKKLYELARKGKTIERAPRPIKVYSFDITTIELPDIHFRVHCSKGTYIRVLAHDIGELLHCGGHLTGLRRTAIGEYRVEDAFTPEEFINLTAPAREIPAETSTNEGFSLVNE